MSVGSTYRCLLLERYIVSGGKTFHVSPGITSAQFMTREENQSTYGKVTCQKDKIPNDKKKNNNNNIINSKSKHEKNNNNSNNNESSNMKNNMNKKIG
ncbi:hypothetical protein PoB_000170700 [Plakobranchus ocellatus]|uniref:Uncharacterized protein n=1 Tax=Plakobranchus ocellatus TaxID=259542 RepID=A0AAV3XZC4_9GAST|nr:hypothetical protein PoB_000170700 [Plakobranchus ocellatus]